jgi:hypothetical protein
MTNTFRRTAIDRLRGTLTNASTLLRGHTRFLRFIVLGHARTGSNYLLAALRKSPAIEAHSEILRRHDRQGKEVEAIISETFSKKPMRIAAVGFKVFYYHLSEGEWDCLTRDPNLRVIHLTRRKYLRTILSLEIAKKTDVWMAFSDNDATSSTKSVTLNPNRLIDEITRIEQQEHKARLRFQNHLVCEITYEDLVHKPGATFSRLATFLGVDDVSPDRVRLVKQNPEDLKRLITNYDEVSAALQTTRFYYLLK